MSEMYWRRCNLSYAWLYYRDRSKSRVYMHILTEVAREWFYRYEGD